MSKKLTLRADNRGIVAIVVTVLLMLILSLIVLAVSQNATREQRQTLDRQLSDQAFYNAESGINEAANYIYTHKDDPTLPPKKDNCNPLPAPANNVLDQSGTNKYTCVLYDRLPPSVQFAGSSEPASPVPLAVLVTVMTLQIESFVWSAAPGTVYWLVAGSRTFTLRSTSADLPVASMIIWASLKNICAPPAVVPCTLTLTGWYRDLMLTKKSDPLIPVMVLEHL